MSEKVALPARSVFVEQFAKGGPAVSHLDYEQVFWDFAMHVVKHQGDTSKIDSLNSKDPENVLNRLMRKGSLDLGGSVDLVQCPDRDDPAGCFVVDCVADGVSKKQCIACAAYQEEKSAGFLKGSETVVKTKDQVDFRCPYFPSDEIPYGEDYMGYMHDKLVERSDYVVE